MVNTSALVLVGVLITAFTLAFPSTAQAQSCVPPWCAYMGGQFGSIAASTATSNAWRRRAVWEIPARPIRAIWPRRARRAKRDARAIADNAQPVLTHWACYTQIGLVFTKKSLRFYGILTGTFIAPRALPNATTMNQKEEQDDAACNPDLCPLLALPAQAQKGSVNINGMIFDPPPEQGAAAAQPRANAAPEATGPRAAAPRNVTRKHPTRHSAQ